MSVDSRESQSSEESFHSASEFVDVSGSIAVDDEFNALWERATRPRVRGPLRASGTESGRSRHPSRSFWQRVKGPRAKKLANSGLLLRNYRNQNHGSETVSIESWSWGDRYTGTAGERIPQEDQGLQDGFETPSLHDLSDGDSSSVSFAPEQSKHRQRLFDAAKNHLFYTIERRRETSKPKLSVLNLSTLQRIILHCIQTDLAKSVSAAYREGSLKDMNSNEVKDTLHAYCNAVRDLDYMKAVAERGTEQDLFIIRSSRALEREILKMASLIPDHVLPKGKLQPALDRKNRELAGDNSRRYAVKMDARKRRLRRFGMAGCGGLLVIVPVVHMAIVPGRLSSLVTTSAAMIVFAVLVTLGTDRGPNDVLATTAAYAAVLVVFVGLSLEKS
ncbi:hypothetical protein KC318_g9309 [Hortaea werneckii]|nr:hypothetical protein KC334_g9338 [Hortaea werneckii]KAI7011354.1 hypothetical protein KC355_g5802 [Hortaea werneckii]KAI7661659.1 hypothetical protein KC318_g9309 [Hortaea werneckii]